MDKTRRQLGLNKLEFPEWLPRVTPQWDWEWPHQLHLYKALQRVTDGLCKRLMIFLPPRQGWPGARWTGPGGVRRPAHFLVQSVVVLCPLFGRG